MQPLVLAHHDIRLELAVVGYQFQAPRSAGDADWLVVELRLRRGSDFVVCRDPCLEADDLQRLMRLLASAAEHAGTFQSWHGPALTSRLSFTEPNLAFEVHTIGGFSLRIYLAAELLPPFAAELDHTTWPRDDDDDSDKPRVSEAWLDFPTSATALQEATSIIAAWQHAFPSRRQSP